MYQLRIYTRDAFKKETETHLNYYADFQERHGAEIYQEALQDNVSAYRINLIDGETGEILRGRVAEKVQRSAKFGDIYFRWVTVTGKEAEPDLWLDTLTI